MADHSHMKLGRKAIKTDSRTLKLASYMQPTLPPPPKAADWTKNVTDWGMMLNDQLGDCTIAGVGHAVQVWTVNNGSMVTVSDAVVEKYYESWDGYKPNDPASDRGGIELDVLNLWRKKGFNRHKLMGFTSASVANLTEVRQAIALFGGVYIGLSLPLSAQSQDVWDVLPNGGASAEKGRWGGHCVFVPKYDQKGFTCVTWGALKAMTTAFWKAYCDETYVLLGADWVGAQGAPAGFSLEQLQADLKAIH